MYSELWASHDGTMYASNGGLFSRIKLRNCVKTAVVDLAGVPILIDCKLKSKIIFLILSIQMFQNCLRNASCKCLRSQGSLSIYFARYISIYLSKQIGLTDVILPQHLFVVSLLNIWFCVPKLKQGQIRKVHFTDSQNLAIFTSFFWEIQTNAELKTIYNILIEHLNQKQLMFCN